MNPVIFAMSLRRRFHDVLQNLLDVLKGVLSSVKLYYVEFVNFGSEIVIDSIVLAIEGDGPLSVRELVPNKGRLKNIELNEFREFLEYVGGVVVFDAVDPANTQFGALQPTKLHAKILCCSLDLFDLVKLKTVWGVYEL
jgi:hypothetical protein